ncbi:MAG: 23S rRNA (guanosine(2251)-2'-O)-methyltransferase RlmB [Deltaproteobacteria bacterium]|nr:23S rRNA (guanosine(2251)-2'-O)-methyltransferase RlmB [Deltaproteobacteria bacterium]
MARYLYGIHPALETLQATPGQVERVLVAQGPIKGPLTQVVELAKKLGVRLEFVPKDQIARLAEGGVHQGVALKVAEFSYVDLPDVVARATAPEQAGLVLVLDGIEDPHNFGALVRSAFALGAHGVVIAKDRAVGVTPVVVKASAGAIAHLPIARVTNLSRALLELKDVGLWVVAADLSGDRAPEQTDLKGPTALVVGSEGQGIRHGVLEKADFRVRIPMAGPLGSLNASVAGALLLYEAARQRRQR